MTREETKETNTLKEQIQELENQRHNIDNKISILRQKYNKSLEIHIGNIYKTYTEDAYIKVVDVNDSSVDILQIDDQAITWDWWSKECVSTLKQLTKLPKDIIDIWKSRGIKLQIKMTTKDAFKQIIKCTCVILVNTWHSINKAVYKYPWVFIIAITFISTIVSIVNIGKARAERDKSNKTMVEMQQKIDTMECIIESRK